MLFEKAKEIDIYESYEYYIALYPNGDSTKRAKEKLELLAAEITGPVNDIFITTTSGIIDFNAPFNADLSDDPKSTLGITLVGKSNMGFRILVSDLVKMDEFSDLNGRHKSMGCLLILSDLRQRLIGKNVRIKYVKSRPLEDNIYHIKEMEFSLESQNL